MKQCFVDFISKRLFLLGQNQILVILRKCFFLVCFCLLLPWGYSQENENLKELNAINAQILKAYEEGRYQEGIILSEKAYKKSLSFRGEKHRSTLSSLSNLAEFYRLEGEYSKAESHQAKAFQLRREALGGKHPDTLDSMNGLIALYTTQGKYKKAESLSLKAFPLLKEVLGEKHPYTLYLMNNLAELYRSQKKHSEAESLYIKTLPLAREVFGEKHQTTLILIHNLTEVYKSSEKYREAEPLCERMWKIRKEVLGENHPHTLISLSNLAGLYRLQGKHKKAEPLFVEILKRKKEVLGEKHPRTLSSMNILGFLYVEKKKYSKALLIFQEYLEKKSLFLKRELRGGAEKAKLFLLQKLRVASDKNNLFSILEEYPKEDFDHLAFYFLLNYKGILLQISRELKQIFRDRADQELAEELLEKRSVYSNLFLDYEKRVKNRVLVEKLEKEIEDLEKKLIWKSSVFRELISDVKVKDVQKTLSKDELLIDFVVYKSAIVERNKLKLSAVVVDKSNIKLISLGDFTDLSHLIQDYRKKIQKKEEARELSQRIYTRIFSPLERHLKGQNKVHLVPDGVLHLLPFRSLLDANGKYLVQSKNLVILSSSQELINKKTKKSNSPVVIFAYPDYGEGDGKEIAEDKKVWFSPLKGTLKEAQDIQKTLSLSAKMYVQNQATEENISLVDSPSVLHIATHGYFFDDVEESKSENKNREAFLWEEIPLAVSKFKENLAEKKLTNPLVYSGLAFSGANDPGKDGILTALEVLGLNLLETDLVVLSACETGVGEVRQGEGVYSLQRAFREAGAKSVLATLWKVDDQATQIFMKKFYQRYMRGDSSQKAVRDTQLEFLRSKRYSHPFYWSSFVMIGGNSDDLEQESIVVIEKKEQGSIIPFILLGLIILIIAFLILAHKKKEKRLLGERMAKRRKRQERVK